MIDTVLIISKENRRVKREYIYRDKNKEYMAKKIQEISLMVNENKFDVICKKSEE